MEPLVFLFAGSVALVLYAYLGYPLSLALLALFRGKRVAKAPIFPRVSFIITAYNEEKRIARKIENTLDLSYPRERLEIVVASDGSSDATDAIVGRYEGAGVILVRTGVRRGKENAQKEAVGKVSGDVIVFSDTATLLTPEGLREIVANFADPSVGCVSSEDRLIDREGKPSGEGFYVRYEMGLRRLETRVSSLVGMSGSFFAARKEVCEDFSGDLQSDFRVLLSSVRRGLRGVADPEAVGFYQDISHREREFDRKVRTVLRGLTVFFRHTEFLNVFRYGLFSYQYFCHKLLRWLVPLFLAAAFVANAFLATASIFYGFCFLAQTAFYGAALWGWRGSGGSPSMIVKVPVYFLTVNVSISVAWWRYLRRQRVVMWTPSER